MSYDKDTSCPRCGKQKEFMHECPAPSPPTEAAVPGRVWLKENCYISEPLMRQEIFDMAAIVERKDREISALHQKIETARTELLKQVRKARAEEKTKMLREAIWIMEECTDWDGGLEELWKLLREAKAEQAREKGK